jgi:hypothetical protein
VHFSIKLIGFFRFLSKLSFSPNWAIINNMSRRSPFIEFCIANRDAVKAENPTAGFGEMGKLLYARWMGPTSAKKAVYSDATNPVRVEQDPYLRRSSRLRNKRLGLDFWGLKV